MVRLTAAPQAPKPPNEAPKEAWPDLGGPAAGKGDTASAEEALVSPAPTTCERTARMKAGLRLMRGVHEL